MKKRVTFWPDNPVVVSVYLLLAAGCLLLYRAGAFSLFGLLFWISFLGGVFYFNAWLWRLEMDDAGILGPGRFGPASRIRILWADAEIHLRRRRGGLRYFVIIQRNTSNEIRIAEANFSRATRRNILDVFARQLA